MGEKFLASKIAADATAGAHQHELAEPPGARPWPPARRLPSRGDGELAEQPNPQGLACPLILRSRIEHVSIIPPRSPGASPLTGGNTAGTPPA
jgi:hypothetical protein